MNRKRIFFLSVIMVILIIIIFAINSKKTQKNNLNDSSIKRKETLKISQDEETGEYVVYNKKTGDEIARNSDYDSLHIYEIDENYNPNPLGIENEYIEDNK